jgi:hypothetical protein
MTISTTSGRNDYTGAGTSATYSYTFRIFDKADLKVIKRLISTGAETVLAVDTDYTVTGVGNTGGGSITLVAGNLASAYKLSIIRNRPLTQETDIRNQGPYFPEVVEDSFDHTIMVAQQLQEQLDRAIKAPETIPPSVFDPALPANIAQADRTFVTNALGNGFDLGPTATQVASAQSYAIAAAASETNAAASEVAAATSATNAAASEATAAALVAGATSSATANTLVKRDASGDTSIHTLTLGTPLGFASGGTSAATKTAALNALVPSVAKGDLFVFDGTNVVRLPVGNNNEIIIADSTQALGVKYGTTPATSLVIQSKTANYTLLTTDDVVIANANGGSFTLTLPAAAGNTGKLFRIKRRDSAYASANTVTISGNLDGAARILYTQNEQVEFLSDGTNWLVIDHKTSTPWTSFTQTVVGATSGTVTKGTIALDEARWRRNGDSIEIRWNYHHTAAGSGGSGTALFVLPNGWAADTSKLTPATDGTAVVGTGSQNHGGAVSNAPYTKNVVLYDSTHLEMYYDNNSGAFTAVDTSAFAATIFYISFSVTIPISGWWE